MNIFIVYDEFDRVEVVFRFLVDAEAYLTDDGRFPDHFIDEFEVL